MSDIRTSKCLTNLWLHRGYPALGIHIWLINCYIFVKLFSWLFVYDPYWKIGCSLHYYKYLRYYFQCFLFFIVFISDHTNPWISFQTLCSYCSVLLNTGHWQFGYGDREFHSLYVDESDNTMPNSASNCQWSTFPMTTRLSSPK